MRQLSALFVLAAAAVPVGAGCAHPTAAARAPVAAAAPAPADPSPSPSSSASGGSLRRCDSDAQCDRGELCIRQQCVTASAGLAECREATVHFDMDVADI